MFRFSRFCVSWILASLLALTALCEAHVGLTEFDARNTEEVRNRLRAEVESFRDRFEANPTDVRLAGYATEQSLRLAKMTRRHQDFRQAEDIHQAALLQLPDSPALLMGLAESQMGRHRFAEALENASRAAELAPEDHAAQQLHGDVLFALGRYGEAEDIYQSLYSDQNLTLGDSARRGQIAFVRGEVENAQESLSEAVEVGRLLKDSPSAIAWCQILLGDMAAEARTSDTARMFYGDALATTPGHPDAIWRLSVLDLERGENLDEAWTRMAGLVVEDPQPAYRVTFAAICQALGLEEEAARMEAEVVEGWEAELAAGEVGHQRDYAT